MSVTVPTPRGMKKKGARPSPTGRVMPVAGVVQVESVKKAPPAEGVASKVTRVALVTRVLRPFVSFTWTVAATQVPATTEPVGAVSASAAGGPMHAVVPQVEASQPRLPSQERST